MSFVCLIPSMKACLRPEIAFSCWDCPPTQRNTLTDEIDKRASINCLNGGSERSSSEPGTMSALVFIPWLREAPSVRSHSRFSSSLTLERCGLHTREESKEEQSGHIVKKKLYIFLGFTIYSGIAGWLKKASKRLQLLLSLSLSLSFFEKEHNSLDRLLLSMASHRVPSIAMAAELARKLELRAEFAGQE